MHSSDRGRQPAQKLPAESNIVNRPMPPFHSVDQPTLRLIHGSDRKGHEATKIAWVHSPEALDEMLGRTAGGLEDLFPKVEVAIGWRTADEPVDLSLQL